MTTPVPPLRSRSGIAVHLDVTCPECGKPGRLCSQREPRWPYVVHYEVEMVRDGGQTFEWHRNVGECFVPVEFAREQIARAALVDPDVPPAHEEAT